MSEPFLSEIKIMAFNFPPRGWAFCNGQLLSINQNLALFMLIGTTYGGDGVTTFALPNLQGRVPIHVGNGHALAAAGGELAHILSLSELSAHSHAAEASSLDGDLATPANNVLAGTATAQLYSSSASNLTPLHPSSITSVGGSEPHENLQPYLVLNFCIALTGIFPSQT